MVDGIELNEDIRNIERVRQEVGMVFQHFNLFPTETVSAELYAGTDLGAKDAEKGSRGAGDALSGTRTYCRTCQ